MNEIIEFLANANTQALFWLVCIVFAVLFANYVKRLSFGDDTGTKAWTIIAIGLFLIGFRISFKVIFPDYKDGLDLQVARYLLGIIGSVVLYYGVFSYYNVINNMYKDV